MKLTDTQRVLLSAASQRDDRALERPSNLTGGAAGKVVAKLLTVGLVEEIQSRGSLPVWRRDGDIAHTLRITKRGLQAIGVEDEATEPAKKPPARSAKSRKSAQAPGHPMMRAGSKQANVIATRRSRGRANTRCSGSRTDSRVPCGCARPAGAGPWQRQSRSGCDRSCDSRQGLRRGPALTAVSSPHQDASARLKLVTNPACLLSC